MKWTLPNLPNPNGIGRTSVNLVFDCSGTFCRRRLHVGTPLLGRMSFRRGEKMRNWSWERDALPVCGKAAQNAVVLQHNKSDPLEHNKSKLLQHICKTLALYQPCPAAYQMATSGLISRKEIVGAMDLFSRRRMTKLCRSWGRVETSPHTGERNKFNFRCKRTKVTLRCWTWSLSDLLGNN